MSINKPVQSFPVNNVKRSYVVSHPTLRSLSACAFTCKSHKRLYIRLNKSIFTSHLRGEAQGAKTQFECYKKGN
jgi:hypothetical protein